MTDKAKKWVDVPGNLNQVDRPLRFNGNFIALDPGPQELDADLADFLLSHYHERGVRILQGPPLAVSAESAPPEPPADADPSQPADGGAPAPTE